MMQTLQKPFVRGGDRSTSASQLRERRRSGRLRKRPLLCIVSPWAHLRVVGMLQFMSDISQPSLPTSFYSVLVSVYLFMALSTILTTLPTTVHFLTLFFRFISALLVLSTTYLFMKVSFSPDAIPSGRLGSKHQVSN